MRLKWIVCTVPHDKREAFSSAQQQWSKLAGTDGFMGQVGGWDVHQPENACILGLWRNLRAYQEFMDNVHDTVTDDNQQETTYTAIATALFYTVIEIPGDLTDLVEAITQGGVLRVADCAIRPERSAHFEQMQHEVWNPGMAAAGGLVAGAFSRFQGQGSRYLVTTLWHDRRAHDAYTKQHLPALQVQSQVHDDLESISGYLVDLLPEWRVLGG